ncbi:MAG: aminotransferase class [Gemmatimonadetes bacterium]|nr:aminotransferase class [Gemmatimonadota bacterium]
MRPFGRCFLPGPTDVLPEILEATLEPMYFTFSQRMQDVLADMQPRLQRMFGTSQTVFISTSAATGLMEAAIRNGVRRRVLVVCAGYFGEMFARVAEGCGKEVLRAMVPHGQVLEPDQLAQFLEGPDVDAVALTHSESSTGALAPLPALAEVVRRRPDVMLLVDGVTSVGAMPIAMDRWGVDFLFTGSQKALALPPGIAVGACSQRYLERAEQMWDRGFYLSVTHLVNAARKNFPLTTPALPVYHALHHQLRRIDGTGGLEPRFARHAAMAALLHEWAGAHPAVSLVAGVGHRSPTVSALRLPEGRTAPDVVAEMERRGWLIATGLAPLTDQLIRIGHMGDLEPEHLVGLLADLHAVLG